MRPLARWLPLTPRLALRDAARNRGRSAPAVAAVMAALAATVGLTMYAASANREDRESFERWREFPAEVAVVKTGPGSTRRRAAEAAQRAAAAIPGAQVVRLDQLGAVRAPWVTSTPATAPRCSSGWTSP